MTATLISLISILLGILGAISLGFYLEKYSFGIIGNTIAGVFGSVFIIKSFGRLGFDPASIVYLNSFNTSLFILNAVISFSSGAAALVFIHFIKKKLNETKT
ncbi:hypothetical protein [Flavicella sediminum]|uniref:hypothetical protein n=1 Tax=Flavicella sediminum TaxID=2585141 RepID=UPI0011247994|nr:hypothetical protein [Flavicella sediminum]